MRWILRFFRALRRLWTGDSKKVKKRKKTPVRVKKALNKIKSFDKNLNPYR